MKKQVWLAVIILVCSVFARYSDDIDEAVNFHEAIVIGSGFGGSVAAFHLATKGVKTLVLERGQKWDTGDGKNENGPFATTDNLDQRVSWCSTVPTLAPLWSPRPQFDGITTGVQASWGPRRNLNSPGQCIITNGVSVVAGAGVGGGSLIYNAIAFYPERKVWEYSRSIYPNSSLYEGLYDELNENYFGRALHRTGAARIPNEIFTNPQWSGARLNQRLAVEAGYGCGHPDIGTNTVPQSVNWDKVKQELTGERVPSISKGEAWFGNNSGAKRSVDQADNYLGKAIATGNVELKTYRNVIDISATPRWFGKYYIYTVTAQVINSECQVVGTETYTTTKLFVAAGTIPSNSLLVRAKSLGKLPNLNEYVGTGFSANGNNGANRIITNGTVIQSAGPGPIAINRFNWDPETEVPIAIEVLPQIVGPSSTNAQVINNFNLFTISVGIPEADEVGHFTYNSTTDCVTLNYPNGFDYGNRKLYKTFIKALQEITPDWISVIAPPPGPGDFTSTVHPLGGVTLGRATDMYCRAKGYVGLYVVDGSIVPFPAGGNPYLTIVSLVERCMDNIIANDF